MPVVSTPPPVTAPKRTPSARQSKTAQARTEAVGGVFQMLGFGCMLAGNLADAGAVSKHSDNITTEIVKLADSDEKIANVIDKLANVGPYGALITALIPLATQLLVNHDRFAASPGMSQMGVVPKAALEAEVRMAMAEAELRAQLAQREAEEQLARVKTAMQATAPPPSESNGQAAA